MQTVQSLAQLMLKSVGPYLTVLFFLTTTTDSLNAACDPLNCDPAPWSAVITDTCYFPDYPNCPITVQYKYRVCGSVVEIDVESYSYSPADDPDCQDLSDDSDTPSGSPDWDFIADRFRKVYDEIIKKRFLAQYEAASSTVQAQWTCDSVASISYQATWGACVEIEFCIVWTGPWPRFTIRIVECGEVCCLQKTSVCYDSTTGDARLTHTFVPGEETCSGGEPSWDGTCWTSSCFAFCAQPAKQSVGETAPGAKLVESNLVTIRPNPFVNETRFTYTVDETAHVQLNIFNNVGQKVATQVEGTRKAGEHTAMFRSNGLPAGVYLYELKIGDEVHSGTIVINP